MPADEEELTDEAAAELSLERVALDARGTREEVRYLQGRYAELSARAGDEGWQRRKAEALGQTQQPGFWNSPGRFAVLGLAEYMDRIEAGLNTAGSLLARLRGDREHYPADLVARLAEQLYLLDAACRGLAEGQARDAFVRVTAAREPGTDRETSAGFARRLVRMYRGWAEKRRMRFALLAESGGAEAEDGAHDAPHYEALLAVSGYAAFPILRPETGLHVLETPQDEKSFHRARVLVHVVAQPDEPAGRGPDALRRQAERAFEADDDHAPPQIVRRYREEPSPLVRDSARGWRTGKLERVLAGDFDLIT